MSHPIISGDPTLLALRAFGIKLRKARLAARRSQQAIATMTGLEPSFVVAVEQGRADPSLRDMLYLAAAVGRDLSALLPAENTPGQA